MGNRSTPHRLKDELERLMDCVVRTFTSQSGKQDIPALKKLKEGTNGRVTFVVKDTERLDIGDSRLGYPKRTRTTTLRAGVNAS